MAIRDFSILSSPRYHRLSFTYNVTPSTNYQYTPAYRYFSSNISLFHFIGPSKPWSQRSITGGGSHSEATGRWWSVYEKHFGWKIREEELKQSQEMALSRGRDGPPRSRSAEPYQYSSPVQYDRRPSTADRAKEQEESEEISRNGTEQGRDGPPRSQSAQSYQYSSPVQQESRPSTADRAEKQVPFSSTDIPFFHPSTPSPELPSPSYQVSIPHREPSPPRTPFESPESPQFLLSCLHSSQRAITPKNTLRISGITESLLSCPYPSQRAITPKKTLRTNNGHMGSRSKRSTI